MNTLEEWMSQVCAVLEIPADVIDMRVVLDLARGGTRGGQAGRAAYNIPVGVAVGSGMSLGESAERIQSLTTERPSRSGIAQ